MRGILSKYFKERAIQRITPVYAGNTWHGFSQKNKNKDHPRLCGEYLTHSPSFPFYPGSPPSMRGILDRITNPCTGLRITPVYAGNTWGSASILFSSRDHPRLCGEYTKKILYLKLFDPITSLKTFKFVSPSP